MVDGERAARSSLLVEKSMCFVKKSIPILDLFISYLFASLDFLISFPNAMESFYSKRRTETVKISARLTLLWVKKFSC